MNRYTMRGIFTFCLALSVAGPFSGVAVEPGSYEEKSAGLGWLETPQPDLPNVLIIGDSISIGYTLFVRHLLKGKANVFRPVSNGNPQNCGSTISGLMRLDDDWLKTQGVTQWDVIHFNWGLHDLKRIKPGVSRLEANDPTVPPAISTEEYGANLDRLVEKMKTTGAKLIFATTTAYPAGVVPCRLVEDAVEYNNVAIEIMQKHDVAVNDLYALTAPRLKELQIPDNVHFTDAGSWEIAQKVSSAIAEALGIAKPEYSEFKDSSEYRQMATKKLGEKDYDGAIEAIDTALLYEHKWKINLLIIKANILISAKRHGESEALLKDVLKSQLSPSDTARVRIGLSRAVWYQERKDEAAGILFELSEFIRENSTKSVFLEYLRTAHLCRGDLTGEKGSRVLETIKVRSEEVGKLPPATAKLLEDLG